MWLAKQLRSCCEADVPEYILGWQESEAGGRVRPRYSLVTTLDRIRPGTAVGAPKSESDEPPRAKPRSISVGMYASQWQLGESPAGCHVCTGCVWCGWNRLDCGTSWHARGGCCVR
jgi:hypothetical protein